MRFDPFTSSSPASLGASGANVAGSTTCAATPGNGCPTVPGLLPSCESLPAWKLGAFTATTGAISVQPYPSSSSTPNLFCVQLFFRGQRAERGAGTSQAHPANRDVGAELHRGPDSADHHSARSPRSALLSTAGTFVRRRGEF